MKNVTIILAVVAMLALSGQAYGADSTYWQGTTGSQDWATPGNWSDGVPDYTTPPIYAWVGNWVTEANTCQITTGTVTDPVTAQQLLVGSNGTVGKVAISDGYLRVRYLTLASRGPGSTGTVTQDGGTVLVRTKLRLGRDAGSIGTYEFNNGTFDSTVVDALTGNVVVGYSAGAGALYIGSATGTFKCKTYEQGVSSDGTLTFDIGATDGTDAITKIEVTGAVILSDDLVIDHQVTLGQSHYVLMTYGSLSGAFDNVTGLSSGWSIEYGNEAGTTHAGEVWLVVPEPATMTLLGIGGLGVLIRRKRRA